MTALIETPPGAAGAAVTAVVPEDELRPLLWFFSVLLSFALLTLTVVKDAVAGRLHPRRKHGV